MARVFLLGILLGFLVACGPPPAPDCTRWEVFCAGLVTAYGRVDDGGLNQRTWEGLQRALTDGLIQRAEVIESVDARDWDKNIAYFAQAGYDLIVTVDYALTESTRLAADRWPAAAFLGVDQPPDAVPRPNLATIVFPEDQGGFLAGALAALITRTGRVGGVCESQDFPSMWRYCEGFRFGARYINPDLRPRVIYNQEDSFREPFQNPEWGRKQAVFLIQTGVDVLFAAGGETARAALETAALYQVYGIGADEDQFYRLSQPEFLVSSAIKRADWAVYDLIYRARQQGVFPLGVHQGAYSLVSYHAQERLVLPTLRERLEAIQRALAEGSLPTGVPPEP